MKKMWLYIDEEGFLTWDEFREGEEPKQENEDGELIACPLFVSGKTYQERKASAEEMACEVQTVAAVADAYYSTLSALSGWLETVARRFGLIAEFRENALI